MLVMDYSELRENIGEELVCTYDSGAVIEGVLLECKPEGSPGDPVYVVVMDAVDIRAPGGEVIEHHPRFSFVPNVQVTLEVH